MIIYVYQFSEGAHGALPRVLLCTRHEANGAFFSTHVKAGHVTHGNSNSPFSIGKFELLQK